MLENRFWLRTSDGFSLYEKSLADVLEAIGIYDTGLSAQNPRDVQSYYDDWHLYSVARGKTVYGLLKLREQENDFVPGFSDLDDPGVTISFISFDLSLLTALADEAARAQALPAFVAGFRRVTELPEQTHNPLIQQYFSDPAAQAPYLIADAYLKKLLGLAENGTLPLPNRMKDAPAFLREHLRHLNLRAGRSIYDPEHSCLRISDPENPTQEELLVLLAAHTSSISFNGFAAEVEYHADALVSWQNDVPLLGKVRWYSSAVRADMQLDAREGIRKLLFSPYYDENSSIVRRQAELHGKR